MFSLYKFFLCQKPVIVSLDETCASLRPKENHQSKLFSHLTVPSPVSSSSFSQSALFEHIQLFPFQSQILHPPTNGFGGSCSLQQRVRGNDSLQPVAGQGCSLQPITMKKSAPHGGGRSSWNLLGTCERPVGNLLGTCFDTCDSLFGNILRLGNLAAQAPPYGHNFIGLQARTKCPRMCEYFVRI